MNVDPDQTTDNLSYHLVHVVSCLRADEQRNINERKVFWPEEIYEWF